MQVFRTIKTPSEFKFVYQTGRRYNGHLMTAFVNANDLGFDRLGITISRKVARRAVDRNRIKRLLRETFRLSANARSDLKLHYDWVFNGRFHLSEVGLTKSSADFKSIIERVQQDEFA